MLRLSRILLFELLTPPLQEYMDHALWLQMWYASKLKTIHLNGYSNIENTYIQNAQFMYVCRKNYRNYVGETQDEQSHILIRMRLFE